MIFSRRTQNPGGAETPCIVLSFAMKTMGYYRYWSLHLQKGVKHALANHEQVAGIGND